MKNITAITIMSVLCTWAMNSSAMNNENNVNNNKDTKKILLYNLSKQDCSISTSLFTEFSLARMCGSHDIDISESTHLHIFFGIFNILNTTHLDPDKLRNDHPYQKLWGLYIINKNAEIPGAALNPVLCYKSDKCPLANQSNTILNLTKPIPVFEPYDASEYKRHPHTDCELIKNNTKDSQNT